VGEGFDLEKKEKTKTGSGLPGAAAFGASVGLLLLLLLALAAAALIWGGAVPSQTPVFALSLLAGLCAFVGGRVSVGRSRGGALVAGGVTGLVLCGVLAAVCLGTSGGIAFPGSWLTTLAALLSGGCLAGLVGRKKNQK